jgi:hypothetical protein
MGVSAKTTFLEEFRTCKNAFLEILVRESITQRHEWWLQVFRVMVTLKVGFSESASAISGPPNKALLLPEKQCRDIINGRRLEKSRRAAVTWFVQTR